MKNKSSLVEIIKHVDQPELYAEILTQRGLAQQMRQCQEEAAELIVAINHVIRGRKGSQENLHEEIADCLIIFAQLITQLDATLIAKLANKKLKKLAKSMPK